MSVGWFNRPFEESEADCTCHGLFDWAPYPCPRCTPALYSETMAAHKGEAR